MTFRGADPRRNGYGSCGLLPDRNLSNKFPELFASRLRHRVAVFPGEVSSSRVTNVLAPIQFDADKWMSCIATYKPCGEGLAYEPRGCVAYVTSLLGDSVRSRGARGHILRVF